MSKKEKIKKVFNDNKFIVGMLFGVIGSCATVAAISNWPVKLDGYADFANRRVTDEDVFKHVFANTNFIDRLNAKKICGQSLLSFVQLSE